MDEDNDVDKESCRHDVVVFGMCAACGSRMAPLSPKKSATSAKEMATHSQAMAAEPSGASSATGDGKAHVAAGFVSSKKALKVSNHVALRLERERLFELLTEKRLCMVLDLDNTLVHCVGCSIPTPVLTFPSKTARDRHLHKLRQQMASTATQPTASGSAEGRVRVGSVDERLEAVMESAIHMIRTDAPPGYPDSAGIPLYLKLRPGLHRFLQEASLLFELYLFTQGTADYAAKALDIFDPDRRLFGQRVFTRDHTSALGGKSIDRIFPYTKKTVVVVDDREDVWPKRTPIIRVFPYLVLMPLINGNRTSLPVIAPPSPSLAPPPTPTDEAPSAKRSRGRDDTNGVSQPTTPPPQPAVAAVPSTPPPGVPLTNGVVDAANDHPPPAKKARREEEGGGGGSEAGPAAASAGAAASGGGDDVYDERDVWQGPSLEDVDHQLPALMHILRTVHDIFFRLIERGGGFASLHGESAETLDIGAIPDLEEIVKEQKALTLNGVVMTTTGMTNASQPVFQTTVLGRLADQAGAQVEDHLSPRTTHLVAARRNTRKYYDSQREKSHHIVHDWWLQRCLYTWTRVCERAFPADIGQKCFSQRYPELAKAEKQQQQQQHSSAPTITVTMPPTASKKPSAPEPPQPQPGVKKEKAKEPSKTPGPSKGTVKGRSDFVVPSELTPYLNAWTVDLPAMPLPSLDIDAAFPRAAGGEGEQQPQGGEGEGDMQDENGENGDDLVDMLEAELFEG
ncbi:unnamed protein product [Vitrella brassicaformis CCMP3155]|uniref:protein-serine/threonine phosphatase n=2 Tax=Vitrella brassicaformis TaxID=1169539 RepID=A0A0G4EGF0_VITBC|nr:unnamed protein product [Vitrella brassicaformis CCMP3155]|eukprot:CEL94553.1 unnamed protein product [Vitrella brassicaformis CCMP3155]